VNSFIVWAKHAYLTGDSGYSGVPKTVDTTHSDRRQRAGKRWRGHDAWAKYDYARLNEVHISEQNFTSKGFRFRRRGEEPMTATLGTDSI